MREPDAACSPVALTFPDADEYQLYGVDTDGNEPVTADEPPQLGSPATPIHDAETVPGEIQDDQVAETYVETEKASLS